MVNYYRDMWKRCSHVLAPLSGMVSPEAKLIWGPEQQKSVPGYKDSNEPKNHSVIP